MSDRPWLEENDPTLRTERELLKRMNAEQPPAGSVDRGWAVLAATIAVIPVVAPTVAGATGSAAGAGTAASSVAGTGLLTKLVVGVALAGGAVWGGTALMKPDGARAPQEQRPVVTSALPQPAAVTPPSVPTEAAEAALPNDEAQPSGPARRSSSTTTLAEEGRLLARAHQLVQAGQGREALEVLRTSATRFPKSVLFQEREVLTIEALGATGAFGAAKARAERFLKRYPKSPHSGRLQRFVE
jgi:hypothetical protein